MADNARGFTSCNMVTGPILQPYCPLKYALRLALAAIWLLQLTICAQTEWNGSRDKLTEGSLPSLVSIVRGNALLSPVYWLLFMPFIIPITFSLWLTSERDEVWRGYMYINMSKIGSIWIPMLAQSSLFGGRQRWLFCIPQQGHDSINGMPFRR